MLKIACDDGSTNVKLAWLENGEIKTHLSGNSFKEGWNSALLGTAKTYNYTVDGKKYSYDSGSTSAIETRHVSYQYGTANLLAIHHALQTSGLTPQDIEITVTLPVTEFFDADNQPNEKNIERKKQNVLRAITLNKGEDFTITVVNVMPESIPAALESLTQDAVMPLERSLIVDLGGTTLDCAIIQGAFEQITMIKGNPDIGTARITKAVINALNHASTSSSFYVADEIIKNHEDDRFMEALVNDTHHIKTIRDVIITESCSLAESVQAAINDMTAVQRIYLTGGGAEIIYPYIKEHFPNHKVVKVNNPQFALVQAMAKAV
ncbi:TPA: plasmid stabilization protein [Salmonella enterica]|nr:plasmid stabilization protein [Salmonella enterica]